jgi:hypothetical protein
MLPAKELDGIISQLKDLDIEAAIAAQAESEQA